MSRATNNSNNSKTKKNAAISTARKDFTRVGLKKRRISVRFAQHNLKMKIIVCIVGKCTLKPLMTARLGSNAMNAIDGSMHNVPILTLPKLTTRILMLISNVSDAKKWIQRRPPSEEQAIEQLEKLPKKLIPGCFFLLVFNGLWNLKK